MVAESRIDELLKESEARGLTASIYARLVFIGLGGINTVFNSKTLGDFIPTAFAVVVGIALQLYCLRLVRRRERHLFVGRSLAAFDCTIAFTLPIVWYLAVGGDAVSPAFLLKNDQIAFFGVLMVINTLALRPLYPALVGWTGVLQMILFAIYAAPDPRVTFAIDHVGHNIGSTVNPLTYAWGVLALLMMGAFLGSLGGWARRAVRSAAELEATNLHIQEEQAQRIMEAKVGALANLVAGIAHEINTPLGVMGSGASTAARSAERLQEAIAEAESLEVLKEDRRLTRGLAAMSQAQQTIEQAKDRIQELVGSLKDFSRLDQAEEVDADLHSGLDATLSLMDAGLKEGVEIVRRYGDIPRVRCKAKAINQVFMTLIENALEALDGSGRLEVETSHGGGKVFVEVADSGPGMTEEKRAALFDVGLINTPDRVAVRLGLPAAQLIVKEHGGKIEVVSSVGTGTRFRIELPVSA